MMKVLKSSFILLSCLLLGSIIATSFVQAAIPVPRWDQEGGLEVFQKFLKRAEENQVLESIKNVHANPNRRNLQTSDRECNSQIAIVRKDELQALMQFFLGLILQSDGQDSGNGGVIQTAIDTLSGLLEYDLSVHKVCMSCEEIVNQNLSTETDDTGRHGFGTYCGPDSYGYTALHSALVFAPIDGETDELLSGVSLRGFMYGRSTIISVSDAITEIWPADVTAVLTNPNVDFMSKFLIFRYFLAPTFAASTGMVSIMPDFLGFGASSEFDRPFLTQGPYMQAFVTTWIATQQYIESVSQDGCTILEDVTTVSGYSIGGFAAITGSLALKAHGTRIMSLHPGGTPMNFANQLGFTMEQLTENPQGSFPLRLLAPYVGYAYSNDFPFLANANTGQYFLAEEYMNADQFTRNIPGWFRAESWISAELVLAYMPENITDIFNPEFVSVLQAPLEGNDFDGFCAVDYVTNNTDFICEAVRDAGLWEAMAEEISFPTNICHSIFDDVVGYANVPPIPLSGNDWVFLYEPNIEQLRPSGDHATTEIFCALDPVTTIAFAPQSTDRPNLITYLSECAQNNDETMPPDDGGDNTSEAAPAPPTGAPPTNDDLTPTASGTKTMIMSSSLLSFLVIAGVTGSLTYL